MARSDATIHRFIAPGKPMQYGFEELQWQRRDQCLNEHDFINLGHAR